MLWERFWGHYMFHGLNCCNLMHFFWEGVHVHMFWKTRSAKKLPGENTRKARKLRLEPRSLQGGMASKSPLKILNSTSTLPWASIVEADSRKRLDLKDQWKTMVYFYPHGVCSWWSTIFSESCVCFLSHPTSKSEILLRFWCEQNVFWAVLLFTFQGMDFCVADFPGQENPSSWQSLTSPFSCHPSWM